MLSLSHNVARRAVTYSRFHGAHGVGLWTALYPMSTTSPLVKRDYSGPPAHHHSNVGPGINSVKPPLTTRIVEKVKEEFHRFVEGSKLLGRNTHNAAVLLNEVRKGHTLNRRERLLMIRTLSDLFRMVPFIVIVIVPFAEFALPVLLKVFPNMLPSTFTSASQKEAAQTRTLQAKLKVLEVLQAAAESTNLRVKLDSKEAQQSLASFLTKVSRGEQIKHDEVLKVSQFFHNEFSVESLERAQLVSLVKFFGLPSIGNNFILQESLKFKWNSIRKDDAHIMRDGIDSLSTVEIQDAAVVRGFNPINSHQDQKQYLNEWISLSQQNVPPYLLLLSRAQYFVRNTKKVADITPPIIAPYMSAQKAEQVLAIPAQTITTSAMINEKPVQAELLASEAPLPATEQEQPTDIPEKELLSVEFKNLTHELSYDPVVSKLWGKIARYTSELRKETFGGREEEVIHIGDSSASNLSTVITTELRQYLQAMFIALDKDGDQRLTLDEVEHGLNASDIPVQRDELVELMKKFDYNGDNYLQFDEFVDCLLYLRKTKC